MKVRCVCSDGYANITVGKEYIVDYPSGDGISITNDVYDHVVYNKKLFEVVYDGQKEKATVEDKTVSTWEIDKEKTNMIGHKYNKLTVISQYRKDKTTFCVCKCECGNSITVRQGNLSNGHTKSCGCYKLQKSKELKTKHGMSGTRAYSIWINMIERCTNPNVKAYKNYGNRGIKICDKWLSFEGFWEDVKFEYSDDLTIDRIDVNKGYEPNNCRWITNFEQQSNKRNNKHFSYFEETKTISQWSKETGINVQTISRRIQKGVSPNLVLKKIKKGGRLI